MRKMPRQVIALLGGLALAAAPQKPAAEDETARVFSDADHPPPAPPVTPALLKLGERVFKGACLGCHGEKGDGDGREGRSLSIPPRDFTAGQFMLRSTPSGSLPLDRDLFRTIRRGIRPDIDMASFKFLSDREVWGVIAFIKTFSPRWKEEKPPDPIVVPETPKRTPALIKEGPAIYKLMQCAACHGEKGRGDGDSAPTLKYDNGKPIKPADFTHPEHFKGGPTVRDIYRTFSTGLDGTPMPSYADTLTEEQRWQLAFYVLSLGEAR